MTSSIHWTYDVVVNVTATSATLVIGLSSMVAVVHAVKAVSIWTKASLGMSPNRVAISLLWPGLAHGLQMPVETLSHAELDGLIEIQRASVGRA
jgi:hypothetical protein